MKKKNQWVIWGDVSTCAFVFSSNVGGLEAHEAMATLQSDFPNAPWYEINHLIVEHSFCFTTSSKPGMLNAGYNSSIVQMSCVVFNNITILARDLCWAEGDKVVGCVFRPISLSVDGFKSLAPAKRVGLAEVLLGSAVEASFRLEIRHGLIDVVSKVTEHLNSYPGNFDFARRQLKAVCSRLFVSAIVQFHTYP